MELSVRIERWPLAGAFTISRGSKTEALVVVAELSDGTCRGRGESVPYRRYGETADGIVAAIEAMRPRLRQGLDRATLQHAMHPGAARNALDCAYWDVNAKASGRQAYKLAGLAALAPLTTAYTISLGSPRAMAKAAERAAWRPFACRRSSRSAITERPPLAVQTKRTFTVSSPAGSPAMPCARARASSPP